MYSREVTDMSDEENYTMQADMPGFADLLDAAGQGRKAEGEVQIYEDRLSLHPLIKSITWVPDGENHDD